MLIGHVRSLTRVFAPNPSQKIAPTAMSDTPAPGIVTTTSESPGGLTPVVHVICVGVAVIPVQGAPPTVTRALLVNPTPSMVMRVPPPCVSASGAYQGNRRVGGVVAVEALAAGVEPPALLE